MIDLNIFLPVQVATDQLAKGQIVQELFFIPSGLLFVCFFVFTYEMQVIENTENY